MICVLLICGLATTPVAGQLASEDEPEIRYYDDFEYEPYDQFELGTDEYDYDPYYYEDYDDFWEEDVAPEVGTGYPYYDERWEPPTFDEGLREELLREAAEERIEESLETLDAPSMYYDSSESGVGFLGDAYGYPSGPAHPHAPVFAEEDPGLGGTNYYTTDWMELDSDFDRWYDGPKRREPRMEPRYDDYFE